MSKLKEKELLEYFDSMCLFLANHHWTKRDERAVAIREMIQSRAEQEEIEVRYIEIILDLYDQMEKKKPEVTEEWIDSKAVEIYNLSYYKSFKLEQITECIRSLVEEMPAKKAIVDEEFVIEGE